MRNHLFAQVPVGGGAANGFPITQANIPNGSETSHLQCFSLRESCLKCANSPKDGAGDRGQLIPRWTSNTSILSWESMFRDCYWLFLVQEHLSNRNQVQNKDKTTVLPTVVSHREIVISATKLPGFTSPSWRFWVIQRLNSDQIRMAGLDVLQKSSFSPQIALETSELVKMPIETAQFNMKSSFLYDVGYPRLLDGFF